MAKITIGSGHDKSSTKIHAELALESSMELHVGDSYDMSLREVSIVERNTSELNQEILRLRELVAAQKSDGSEAINEESEKIAKTAERIVSERRWYSVSTKGLIEAASAVGSVASPIVASALKVVALLKEARG